MKTCFVHTKDYGSPGVIPMDTIHERQRKILTFLSDRKNWQSITEIDCALFKMGLSQSRRTIARDLELLERNGLISQSKNKNKIEYKISNYLEINLKMNKDEAHALLTILEASSEATKIQDLVFRLKELLG